MRAVLRVMGIIRRYVAFFHLGTWEWLALGEIDGADGCVGDLALDNPRGSGDG